MSDFAARLRTMREKNGLRQVDLARALGVAQTTIANYEGKSRFPDEDLLRRFADFFDVSLDFLLGRSALEKGDGKAPGATELQPASLPDEASRYLALVRANEVERAAEAVEDAMRTGLSLSRVYLGILQPALVETGRLWEHGELGVGEEHAISAATQRVMARLVSSVAMTSTAGRPRCLILATAGEAHVIGPVMVGDLLRLDGWDVVCPGGNLGIRHVKEMVARLRPRLVGISVTMPANAAGAADLVSALKSRTREPRIMVGGRACRLQPSLWREIGADATAVDAVSAVAAASSFRAEQGQE